MGIFDDIGDAVGDAVDSVTGGGSDDSSSGGSDNVSSQPGTTPGGGRDTSGNLGDSGSVDLGGGGGGGGGGSSGGGGGGSSGGGGGGYTPPGGGTGGPSGGGSPRPDFSDVSVGDITDAGAGAVDTVTDTVNDVQEFVQSGPDEPSVGDDGFSGDIIGSGDYDRPEPLTTGSDPNSGSGPGLVTDDAASNLSEDQLTDARQNLTDDLNNQTPGYDIDARDITIDFDDGRVTGELTETAQSRLSGPDLGFDDGRVPQPEQRRPPVSGEKMSNTVPVSDVRDTTPNINRDVVDEFTASGGVLSDNANANDGLLPGEAFGVDISEDRTRALAERGQNFADGIDDSGIGGSVAAGFGTFGGDLAALPQTAESGAETVQNAPSVVGEFGFAETGRTVANVGTGALRNTARSAVNDPVEFGTAAGLGIVTGSAASRAAELGTTGLRTRVEGFRGPDIDAQDTTFQTDRVEAGEQPVFETGTDAPGAVARDEFETRALDQPDELTDAVDGGPVTLRSETDRLPRDLEAQEGNFELPGLFSSGDFAPLRFGEGGSTFGVPEVRAPRLFGQPERASAFETPEIDAIPEDAAGSGFALRQTDSGEVIDTGVPQGEAARRAEEVDNIERIPDPEEPGVQFLNEEADAGTAFVRPGGDRTPEFEAIFPPGTRFERETTGTISARGETGTLDIFRLADDQRPADAPDVDGEVGGEGVFGDGFGGGGGDSGDFLTASEISERYSGGREVPESTPVAPTPAISSGGGAVSSGGDLFGSDAFGDGEFSNPFDGRPGNRTPDSTRQPSIDRTSRDTNGASTRSSSSGSSRSASSSVGSPFGSGLFGSGFASVAPDSRTTTPAASTRPAPSSGSLPSGGGSSGGFGGGGSPFGDFGSGGPGGPGSGGPTSPSSPPSDPSSTRPLPDDSGRETIEEETLFGPLPETPEFANPVASGASDIFGAFGQQ